MKSIAAKHFKRTSAALLITIMTISMAACSTKPDATENLISNDKKEKKIVNLFGPMEKSKPNATNAARNAFDRTIQMAEKELGLTIEYRTYTAENYQEKTYDDVTLDRVRSNMDDFYLLNPDVIQRLGSEGELADLSGLKNAENLREVVITANTVDGKLVAIPQEVVAYGLFVNADLFQKYKLKMPETPEDLLEAPLICPRQGLQKELSDWFQEKVDRLNIVATCNLAYNGAVLAREGLGCLLSFDKLADTGPDSPLCLRPLTPPLHSRLFLAWKKYAVFSPAAEVLLNEMKSHDSASK